MTTFSRDDITRYARQSYEHGQASFDIIPPNCALLVIDMQDEFIAPHSSPYWVPAATDQVPRIQNLIDTCRDYNIPVIYTVFSRTHHYLDRPISGPMMPNRFPNVDFDDSTLFINGKVWHELAPRPDEVVIHKPSYGAFYDTPLETILKNLAKDTVIICGTLTNYCCGTTARQAYERGYKVVFGSDITATDDPDMQEPELKVLRKGFARVLSGEEIIAQVVDCQKTS